jgi:hypothetical protein
MFLLLPLVIAHPTFGEFALPAAVVLWLAAAASSPLLILAGNGRRIPSSASA